MVTKQINPLEGFKLLLKKWDYLKSKEVKISGGTIRFGEDSRNVLKDYEFCSLLFNKSIKQVAFKGTDKKEEGYGLSQYRSMNFNPRFAKLIPKGIYEAKITVGVIIIDISKNINEETKDFWEIKN